MQALNVFVDYDNVDPSLKRAGPVSLGRTLAGYIPSATLVQYDAVKIRLYGGWRVKGSLTNAAQRIIPDIQANSLTVFNISLDGGMKPIRLKIELAQTPISNNILLEETLVRDRDLRKFRVKQSQWTECAAPGLRCGFSQFSSLAYDTPCTTTGCSSKLSDLFVRDEQKMVDTLLVADLTYQCLSQNASNIVVVSSDIDMWPGVLVAIKKGCNVIHLHPRRNWKTQHHLLRTISRENLRFYQQFSI